MSVQVGDTVMVEVDQGRGIQSLDTAASTIYGPDSSQSIQNGTQQTSNISQNSITSQPYISVSTHQSTHETTGDVSFFSHIAPQIIPSTGGFGFGQNGGLSAVATIINGLCVNINSRRQYVEEVPDDLKCPICFDGAITCSTHCKHTFCINCINSHIQNRLRQSQPVNCPMCRANFHGHQLHPVQADICSRVKQLRVACIGMPSGCKESGSSHEVEIHEMSCEYIVVPCRFKERGCSSQIMRKEVKNHESRCRYNPDVCPCKYQNSGCKVRGTEDVLKSHQIKCSYRNMNKYVPCPHKSNGCNLLVKKRYRDIHAELCMCKIVQELSSEDIERCGLNLILDRITSKKSSLEEEHEELSSFLPNIVEVREGDSLGKIHVIINNLPMKAVKALFMATDSHISCSLKDAGFRLRGISTIY